MIGERIKQRRQALGLSLQDVSDRLGLLGETITRAGLSKYENGKSMPKAQFIWNLAKVLSVKNDYFFTESKIGIKWLAFRKNSSLTRKAEDTVKSHAAEYMERFLSLEAVLSPDKKREIPAKTTIQTIKEAEDVAANLRKEWELNSWPIESVTQLLESKGFYVMEENIDDRKFDGLSGVVNNNALLIISKSGISVDCKRFNLAHELGHHVINIETDLSEKASHRFASAFLMPAQSLLEELGASRRNIDLNELLLLKEKYGISVQSLTVRCRDLGIINENVFRQMFMFFRSNYWHVNEPGLCPHREEPVLFRKMIFKAVAEGVISSDKAETLYPGYAEIGEKSMNRSGWKWNDLINVPPHERERALKNAADAAVKDYVEGSELRSFEAGGDIYDETM